jgi:hypothetical protein
VADINKIILVGNAVTTQIMAHEMKISDDMVLEAEARRGTLFDKKPLLNSL